MSAIFERLGRVLPERHAPGKNSFATEPKALREWIDHLPLANPSATARLLINALHEMNQLRLDPAQRFAAMEALRGPIGQVSASLDRMVNADVLPLPPAKRQLGEQIGAFDSELGLGYAALVYDLCAPAGAVPFMRGKLVAAALLRALQHYGGQLYRASLLYQAPVAGVWQMLHDLFQFAVAVRLDEKRIDDPLQPGVHVSARDSYTQSLLFALSNPYRFTQKESAAVHDLTRTLGSYCELRPGRAPEGAIAVRVDRDAGPGYLPEEREAPREDVWAFQISGLTRLIDAELAQLAPGALSVQFRPRGVAPIDVDLALVEKLGQTWTGTSARAQTRLPAGHRLDCVIGMHSVHYVLCDNLDFDGFLRSIRGLAISLREGDRVAAWTSTQASDVGRVIRGEVRVLDQSLSGYRIQWQSLDGLRVRVGELVALAPPADDGEPQDWMVGAIRWLRLMGDGTMEGGVALLSRRALPVGLRTFDEHRMPRAPMRGLLLEPLAADPGAAAHTVLAPQLIDRNADRIELMRAPDPFAATPEPIIEMIHAPRIVDRSSSYVQIEVGQPGPAADGDDGNAALRAANDELALAAGGDD